MKYIKRQNRDQIRMISLGEMLDCDAPTRGYLLQACFSMGFRLTQHLNTK